MIQKITALMKAKAKLWRDWEIKMLNMRVSEFQRDQIRRWGVKNLAAYNQINQHIDYLTQIIFGYVQYIQI